MNSGSSPRADREAALLRIDARLAEDPLSIDLALDRARLLAELDRGDEARDAYLRVVARAPDDVRALNDFGTFLVQGGYRAAARTVYERALAVDPHSALIHANLAGVFFADTDYASAREHYEAALVIEPDRREAHQGLSYALTRLGLEEDALHHRKRGFAGRALSTGSYRGTAAPVDVLLLVAAAGGTLYTETFLDDRIFRTTTLVADHYAGSPLLPQVDVVFNAISDADRAEAALVAMAQLLVAVDARVINAPDRVLATAREANAARLGTLAGVRAARTASVLRADLSAARAEELGFTFPLLVRAPGFHTGQFFSFVERADQLADAVAALPGNDVLLVEYIDVRDDDGRVRKYRAMIVGAALFPMHVAIAEQWKVHYFTADMTDNAANRAEDERFLADPGGVLGAPAMAALERVRDMLGLEYAGIDFALDRHGNVVVFEANATMIVLPPAPDPIWDYRREPVSRIVAAVTKLLLGSQ